jgi:hypothetical protein
MKNLLVSALLIASALFTSTTVSATEYNEIGHEIKNVTLENGEYCFRDSDNNVNFASAEAFEGGGKGSEIYMFESKASWAGIDKVLGDPYTEYYPERCTDEFGTRGYEKGSMVLNGNTINYYKDTDYNWCIAAQTNGLPIGAFRPCDVFKKYLPEIAKRHNLDSTIETVKLEQPATQTEVEKKVTLAELVESLKKFDKENQSIFTLRTWFNHLMQLVIQI